MPMSEAKIEKAVGEYIDNGFNKTQTYLATHPNTTYPTANSSAPDFIAKNSIEERALAIIAGDKNLTLKAILKGFNDDLKAEKASYVRGERYTDPDNSIRFECRKFLTEKVYGVGKRNEITTNATQVNINVTAQDTGALSTILDRLGKINTTAQADRAQRAEAVEDA